MTCQDVRPFLSALADRELDGDLVADVAAHVAGCAACAAVLAEHEELSRLVAAAGAPPAVSAARWVRLDAELAASIDGAGGPRASGFGPLVQMAAGIALVAGGAFAIARVIDPPRTIAVPATRYHVPLSIPYRDPASAQARAQASRSGGLEGAQDAGLAAGLSPAARRALDERGLVVVPGAAEGLAELYAARSGPARLVTFDAAYAVYAGAVRRASLEVERSFLAPRLRRLIELLGRELQELDREATRPDARAAIELARDVTGVAAILEGLRPNVAPGRKAAVESDAARVLAGEGAARSLVLGRLVEFSALRPRGAFEGDLAGHARTVAWLGAAGLAVDGRRDGEARAALALVAALARGRTADGSTGLALWNELDDAAAFLHGPPDDLGAFDLLRALRTAVGEVLRGPDDLADPGIVSAVVERVRLEGRATGAGAVQGVEGSGLWFRLVGGALRIEAFSHARLSAPKVRRARPSSLDVLAALGSRRARSVLAGLGLDGDGYDRGLEDLAPVVLPAGDPHRAFDRPGGGLERARLLAAAALQEPPPGAAPYQGTQAYGDRLLAASLATLAELPPSTDDSEPELGTSGRPILVEPHPVYYARLAHGARRLVLGVEAAGGGSVPAVARALARASLAARVLDGLAGASTETLEGRPLSDESRNALSLFPWAARALAPKSTYSAESLFVVERRDGGRDVIQRTSGPCDTVWALVPIAGGGRRLARGVALATHDVAADRELAPSDVARAPRPPLPTWASHVVPE